MILVMEHINDIRKIHLNIVRSIYFKWRRYRLGGIENGISKRILWGGSISAAQIEGGWNEGGKSPVLVDYCTAGSTKERRQIWYLDKNGQRAHRNWEAVDELEEGCKFAFFR